MKSELFTKQACRDAVVVYLVFFFSNNIYFVLLICIEHCFMYIELYTLHIYIYVYTKVFEKQDRSMTTCKSQEKSMIKEGKMADKNDRRQFVYHKTSGINKLHLFPSINGQK